MFTDRLFPTNKANECPICGNTTGKCRTKDNEEQAVLCGGTPSAKKFDKEGLYICVNDKGKGHTTHTWILAKDDAWDDAAQARYHLEKCHRLELTTKAKQEALERELGLPDRDKHHRAIQSQLFLSAVHKKHLLDRGLTDEQISAIGFVSITKFQKLKGTFPDTLPGYNYYSKNFTNFNDGILIPIFQEDKIAAFKNRLDEANDGQRYSSISSQKYTSFHLYGESPLAVLHGDKGQGLWLAEGELKPLVANQKFNIAILGGAKYWQNSPNHCAKYLLRMKEIYGNRLNIALDAGDILNQQVMSQVISEYKFFESQGFDVYFCWWNQITKESNDIDELDALDSIQFIKLDKLEEIIKESKQESISNWPSTDWKDQVLGEQRKLHTLTYKPDFVPNPNEKYLPNNLVDIIPHKGIVLLGGPKGAGKSVFIDRTKDKLCGGYWEEKTLPSQLSLTGENKPVIERIYHEKTGIRFISITARIALGRGQAIEWDITWIEDGDLTKSDQFDYEGQLVQTATFLETADGIGLCWDSLAKLFDRDWSNSIVVIDEIELGLSHVATSSTCKDRRSKILSTLETKLKECLDGNGLVIGADADLTDITYDYLTAICPGHKPFIVKHDYIRPDADKWDIDFYSGKKDEVISLIENWLSDKDCEPIAVATDNQTEAEGLANHLIKKYPWLANSFNGLIRIDSTITKTDFGKDFVKRPNEKIQEYQPKILIYTPSMGVGCSLDTPYFKYVFGLFFGNLEPSQARQMLARVRQPVPRIVWAADRGQTSASDDFNSFLPSAIKKQVFSHNDLTTQVIDLALNMAKQQTESNDDADILPKLIEQLTKMMGSNGSWNNPHIDLFCKLKARRNFALSQLALQLRQELIDEQHNINDYAAEEKTDVGDRVKGEKLEIKMNRATKTANAADIDLQQAKEINRKPNPTDEEQYQANKAFLKDELPGIDLSSDFIFKAVHKDNRRWLNSIKFYWMINNIDATKEADRRHWRYKLKQFCDGVSYLPDIRTFSGKVEAINKINLFDAVPLDDFETEYFNDSEDLKLWFINSVIPHKKLLKNAFNLTVKKDTEIVSFINRLLSKIGLKLKQSRKEGNVKYYCLDAELALDEDRTNVLKALDLKRELQLKAESEAKLANQSPIPNYQSPITNPQPPIINNLNDVVEALRSAADWGQIAALPQELINEAWGQLTPDDDARLRQLHQQYQQPQPQFFKWVHDRFEARLILLEVKGAIALLQSLMTNEKLEIPFNELVAI